MIRRIISIFLAVCLMFGLLPVGALAATPTSGSCGKYAKWSYHAATKTLTISGRGDMADYKTERGGLVDNPPPWDAYREEMEHAVINSGITSIGSEAFGSQWSDKTYPNLRSVSIAPTVTKIGDAAFNGAKKLDAIELTNVTSLGSGVFQFSGLKSIYIPASLETIPEDGTDTSAVLCFLGCSELQSIIVSSGNPKYHSVDGVLFAGTALLCYPAGKTGSNYAVPNGTTKITGEAFRGNSNITAVSIPASVQKIGNFAFMYCDRLQNADLAEGITSVASTAFSHTAVATLVLPASVTDFTSTSAYEDRSDTAQTLYFTGKAAPAFDGLGCTTNTVVYYPENATGWDTVQQQDDVKHYIKQGWLEFRTGTPPVKATAIEPMSFGDLIINGAGTAISYYLLTDANQNPVPGVRVSYTLSGTDGSRTIAQAVSDGNGILAVPTPQVTADTSFTVVFRPYDANTSYSGSSQTFDVRVKQLSYSQRWKGALKGIGELGLSAGVGVALPVSAFEATLGKLAASGEISASVEFKETYEDGVRSRDMLCTYDEAAQIKANAGIDASVMDNVKLTLIGAASSAKINHAQTFGLHLDNYNPISMTQTLKAGTFLMQCALLPSNGSVFVTKLLETLNLGANAYKSEGKLTIKAGASAVSLKIGPENGKQFSGGVLGLDADSIWTFTHNFNLYNNQEIISKATKASIGAGILSNIKYGDDTDNINSKAYIFGAKHTNSVEMSATTDHSTGELQALSYKVYDGDESGIAWFSRSNDIFATVTYQGDAAKSLAQAYPALAQFAAGDYLAMKYSDVISAFTASSLPASVTETYKSKTGMDGEFPIGVAAGLDAKIGLGISGEDSYEFVKNTAATHHGTIYTTTMANATLDTVREKTITLDEYVTEPLRAITEKLSDTITSIFNTVVGGVKNAWSSVKGTVSGWYLEVRSMVSSSTQAQSYAMLSVMNADADADTASVAVTVGDPYIVAVYADRERKTLVSDEALAEHPLTLELQYTAGMLAAAGAVSSADIRLFHYDPDRNLYICCESTHDPSTRTVSAQITQQGEYILGVDTAAPLVDGFMLSDGTLMPTITAVISDMSGIGDFSFYLDGNAVQPLVTMENLSSFYDTRSGVFTYSFAAPLTAGEHTASFLVTDTLGNRMREPVSFSFRLSGFGVTFTSFDVPTAVNIDEEQLIVTAATTQTATISGMLLSIKTPDGNHLSVPMTLGTDGVWTAALNTLPESRELTLCAIASDSFGNSIRSDSRTVTLLSSKTDAAALCSAQAAAAGNGVNVTCVIAAPGTQALSGILIAAAYDIDGKMLACTQVGVGLQKNEQQDVSLRLSGTSGQAFYVKLFFYNPTQGNTPICRSILCLVR